MGKKDKDIGLYKRIMCGVAVLASITISFVMVFISDTPTTIPLSAIGYQNRLLFFFWGVTTSSAVYFNLKLMARNLKFKSIIFDWVLIIGCSMAIVTVIVMGYHPVRRIIHVGSAGLFGVLTVMCVLALLIVKLRKKSKLSSIPYLTAVAVAGVIFIFASAQVGWFTALTQVILATACLVTMFATNFLEKWPSDEKKIEPLIEPTSLNDTVG
ncbi:MAG: hypothetical protein FWE31_03405 [Firmicutes bacterium]|nr:hypothetical protein [Bacillota bacterium]